MTSSLGFFLCFEKGYWSDGLSDMELWSDYNLVLTCVGIDKELVRIGSRRS